MRDESAHNIFVYFDERNVQKILINNDNSVWTGTCRMFCSFNDIFITVFRLLMNQMYDIYNKSYHVVQYLGEQEMPR